jgi:hypothetical protein
MSRLKVESESTESKSHFDISRRSIRSGAGFIHVAENGIL